MTVYDFNILPKLIEGKSYITFEEIPKPFRQDLRSFIVGETFMKNDKNEIRIGSNLYNAWLQKLFKYGFDYDIKLISDE